MPRFERAYLCNGYGCDKKCAENLTAEEWKNYPCHHTLNENYARNKCRRTRRWVCEHGKFMEIDGTEHVNYDKKS